MFENDAEHQIISIDDYIGFLDQFSQYQQAGKLFFRAQNAEFQNIVPTIARNKYSHEEESNILDKEMKKSKNTLFNTIAHAQHYGLPTRFLDFTTDPLVALFFAVDNPDRSDSIIFMFIQNSESYNSIHANVLTQLALSNTNNFLTFAKDFNKSFNQTIPYQQLYEYASTPVFIKRETISDNGNERMHRQSGTFVICTNSIENNVIGDISGIEFTNRYMAIVVPFEYKEKIRNQLIEKEIVPNTIYPENGEKTYPSFNAPERLLSQSYTILNPEVKRKAYTQYSAHIALNGLFTLSEIKAFAMKFSRQRVEKRIFLWFARDEKNAQDDRNNLVLIFDEKKENLFLNQLKKGIDYVEKDGYVPLSNYFDNPNNYQFKQKIPISKSARKIYVQVKGTKEELMIETNLFDGANLFVSSDSFDASDTNDCLVSQNKVVIPINLDKDVISGEFSIILTYPNVQTKKFIEKAGIQYENIDSDAMIRNNTISVNGGYKM